ncbi:hypothetical protein LEMLEM_LOCUS1922, partial [Lemmus lemmus]
PNNKTPLLLNFTFRDLSSLSTRLHHLSLARESGRTHLPMSQMRKMGLDLSRTTRESRGSPAGTRLKTVTSLLPESICNK